MQRNAPSLHAGCGRACWLLALHPWYARFAPEARGIEPIFDRDVFRYVGEGIND